MAEPQYYISQGSDVQGPYPRSRIESWIAEGKVRSDMMFSLDGGPWVTGQDCPDLFPIDEPTAAIPPPMPRQPAAPPRAVPPMAARAQAVPRRAAPTQAAPTQAAPTHVSPRRRGGRDRYDDDDDGRGAGRRRPSRPRGPPAGVMAVSIFDFIGALLGAIGGMLLLNAASQAEKSYGIFGQLAEVQDAIWTLRLVGYIVLISAALNLVMGIWIRSGQPAARTTHIVFAALALLGNLWGALNDVVSFGTISALAINILIIVILSGRESAAFFSGRDDGGAPARGGRTRRRRR